MQATEIVITIIINFFFKKNGYVNDIGSSSFNAIGEKKNGKLKMQKT